MSVVDTNGEWPGVLWRQKPILRVMHARIPTCRLISLGHATQTASGANLIFQNTNTNLETRLVLKKHKLRLAAASRPSPQECHRRGRTDFNRPTQH